MMESKAQGWRRIFLWSTLPNRITTMRILMLFPVLCFLYTDLTALKAVAIVSLVAMLWMDKLDGYLARKLDQITRFGSIFDIAGDRIIEVAFWIAFAHLKLIPLWVPIVILTRGILTDSVRYDASSKDRAPFGKASMMRSKWSEFIVGSNFMRAIANVKILAFILLILSTMHPHLLGPGLILTYLSVFINVLRGIPVILDAHV